MSDPTPEQASARVAELRSALNDPTQIGPRDSKRRDAAVNEIARLDALTRPVVPTPTPTIPFEERRAAALAGTGIRRDLLKLSQGHPDEKYLIEDAIRQSAIAHAPGARGPEINLPFDVVQNPGVATAPEPTVELGKLGALAGKAQWDIPALEDGQAAADDAGMSDSFEAIAHVVQRLHHERGQRWTAETAAKELESVHGASRAEEIKAAATALHGFLQSNAHGAKWLSFVERLGLLYHPELIVESASRWNRREKTGAS
jgi:hypothetical protein